MKEISFYTQNDLAQLGQTNKQKVDDLLAGFLKNFNSPHTTLAYKRDLMDFFSFIRWQHDSITSINHSKMVAYKNHLASLGLSFKTINRKLAAVYSFYEYLMDEALVPENPVRRVQRYKIEKEIVTDDISDDDLEKLWIYLDSFVGKKFLPRVFISTLFNTGMRQGEARSLKLKNLDYEGNSLVFRYIGKGNKVTIKAINDRLKSDLGMYFNYLTSQGIELDPDDYLFCSFRKNSKGPIDQKTADYYFKKVLGDLGMKGKISPHTARATFAGKLLDAGHSIHAVAAEMKHKDIRTTASYNKRKSDIGKSLVFGI